MSEDHAMMLSKGDHARSLWNGDGMREMKSTELKSSRGEELLNVE
jgi:hypothetical protein